MCVTGCDLQLPGGVEHHCMTLLPYVHFLYCSRWLRWLRPGGVFHRAHSIVGVCVVPRLWGKDRAGAVRVGSQLLILLDTVGGPSPSLAIYLLWAYMGCSKTQWFSTEPASFMSPCPPALPGPSSVLC